MEYKWKWKEWTSVKNDEWPEGYGDTDRILPTAWKKQAAA
jgi:hypothetical protein